MSSIDPSLMGLRQLQAELAETRKKLDQAMIALHASSLNLKEWRHANEAHRLLAQDYAKALGVSADEHARRYDQMVCSLGKQQADFRWTDTMKASIRRTGS